MNRLRSVTAALVLILAATSVSGPSAHAQGFGIMGGLNFHELDDIRAANASATYDGSTGYHIGAFFDFKLGPVSIRPGALYRQVGSYDFTDLPGVEGSEFDFDVRALEVPIDVRLRVLPLPVIKPYLLAGPVLTFPWANNDFNETESINLNADIGVGGEIALRRITLMPELRFGIATTSLLKDEFDVAGVNIQPQDDPRLNSVMLRLNIGF